MSKYFNNIKTIEELKREYKKLAMQLHPDMPTGDLRKFQDMQNEYEMLFERVKNTHETKDGKTQESKTQTTETATDYSDIINSIITFDAKIEIVGSWIWVTFESKPSKEVRDTLKANKFFFNSKRNVWQWKPAEEEYKKTRSKEADEAIKNKYGCKVVNTRKPVFLT